jgi:hypothetical protein
MSENENISGRRVYDRFEANTTALVSQGVERGETFIMENISARGAAVLGYRPFEARDKLTILFRLPFLSPRAIHKQARVAWCRQIKDGVWESGLDFGLDNTIMLQR